jgi:hypothetical protein
MAFLNPVIDLKVGDTILMTSKGEPLWNIRLINGENGGPLTYELFSKATGERFSFNPVIGSTCQQDPTQQSSNTCHECHSVER